MKEPPKRELADGTISEYRGRPTLVDVLRTIEIIAEENASVFRRQQAERDKAEWRRLEQRRKDHPEEFFGLADVLKAANVSDTKQVAKAMPNVRTVWPDIDPDRNKAKIDAQAAELLKQTESK